MKLQSVVISLRRTPERLAWFLRNNPTAADGFGTVEGIDGQELLETLSRSRLISASALQRWTPGALGVAMSHLRCWQQCLRQGQPMVIAEDDVVLAPNWQAVLHNLYPSLGESWDLVLMGWNYNSVLHCTDACGMESLQLFEPTYPDLPQIRSILQSNRPRQLQRLKHAFGLPAYVITPAGAARLLAEVAPLRSVPLKIGRGVPMVETFGVDGLMNLSYGRMDSWVVNPPLAVALNNPNTSLTQAPHTKASLAQAPSDFGHSRTQLISENA